MNFQQLKNRLIEDLQEDIPGLKAKNDSFSIVRLKSKKNLVYELTYKRKPRNFPKEIVIKIFQTHNFQQEVNVLKLLNSQKINVPSIIFSRDPYLILEKVEGMNLCDYVNTSLVNAANLRDLDANTRKNLVQCMRKLATWLAELHKKNTRTQKDFSKAIVLNKGDTRLRDFIIDESEMKIFGVDFEESYEGNHMDDIAWICCSLLDSNPGIFQMEEPTHKVELINTFLQRYYLLNNTFKFSFDYFAEHLIENLNLVIERRSMSTGPLRKRVILERISKRF
ncbi:MAG: hypothetical protein GF383_03940 [Candidatus Lokiarchaeota archaeon]|nr:hypothetical protein [Candidatus Lokiarchaeota archaeon]MBD3338876.1 hypothetical protein [Candidatus Lokiarchaeota archaeon]